MVAAGGWAPVARAPSVAAWLGCGMTVRTVSHLLDHPRLADRLDALLLGRLGLPTPATPMQAALLEWDALALAALANRAGASCLARPIARLVTGSQVRALVDRIGPSLRQAALSDCRAAMPAPYTGPGLDLSGASADALADALPRIGLSVLHVWCAAQPPAIGVRVALRLPPVEDAILIDPRGGNAVAEAAFASLA